MPSSGCEDFATVLWVDLNRCQLYVAGEYMTTKRQEWIGTLTSALKDKPFTQAAEADNVEALEPVVTKWVTETKKLALNSPAGAALRKTLGAAVAQACSLKVYQWRKQDPAKAKQMKLRVVCPSF